MISRQRLANLVPSVGRVVRLAIGLANSTMLTRASYSQHGEDAWIMPELLKTNLTGGIYVEVGANHPTRLSNTYLLYRHGLTGIVIEPNSELAALHRRIRPRDSVLCAGCGSESGAKLLHVASAPVLSSFSLDEIEGRKEGARVVRSELVPVLTLDSIVGSFPEAWVYFLSIDTEGFDLDVVRGALTTLRKTLFLCVECVDSGAEAMLRDELSDRFEVVKALGCNLIFQNRSFRPPTELVQTQTPNEETSERA